MCLIWRSTKFQFSYNGMLFMKWLGKPGDSDKMMGKLEYFVYVSLQNGNLHKKVVNLFSPAAKLILFF